MSADVRTVIGTPTVENFALGGGNTPNTPIVIDTASGKAYFNNAGTVQGLGYDSNGNLIIGGAPSGAVSTDLLQVNGDALIGNLRITSNGLEPRAGAFNIGAAPNSGVSFLFQSADSSTGAGQPIQILTGSAIGGGSYAGGAFTIGTGTGGPAEIGGDMNITLGAGGGLGGGLFASAGSGTDIGGTGGKLSFAGGQGDTGGDVEFTAGPGTGVNGSVLFVDGNFNTVLKIFDGNIYFGTYTAGVLAPTGYITIKDSGGTTCRLLVG